jgi:AbrB family looped-hinge helix DNA binding protein
MHATVAERGQVTIPKSLRDRLGIGPHTVLDFEADHGRLLAVKVTPEDPMTAAIGCLKHRRGTDEVMKDLRGEP